MIPDTSDNSVLKPSYTETPSISSNSAIKRAAGRSVVSPHFITSTFHSLPTPLGSNSQSVLQTRPSGTQISYPNGDVIARWRPYGHQVQAPVSRRVPASCLPESRDSSHTNSYEKRIDSTRTKQSRKSTPLTILLECYIRTKLEL